MYRGPGADRKPNGGVENAEAAGGNAPPGTTNLDDVGSLTANLDLHHHHAYHHHHHDHHATHHTHPHDIAIDPAIGLQQRDDAQLRQALLVHNKSGRHDTGSNSIGTRQNYYGEEHKSDGVAEAAIAAAALGETNHVDAAGFGAPPSEPPAGAGPAPTTGPDGQPIDPKKTCPFCGRHFSHPGSLGRHLDLKRGTRLHPAARVDMIRGDVKRRGDVEEIKARRAKRAKMYNAREDVKMRARLRRKMKERGDRAKEEARVNFINRLGYPTLPERASFAYLVLYFLPPAHWPQDPPSKDAYEQLLGALETVSGFDPQAGMYRQRLESAWDAWSMQSPSVQRETWHRETRRAAEAALGQLALYDLGCRGTWLAMEETRLLAQMNIDAAAGTGHSDSKDGRDDDNSLGVSPDAGPDMAAVAFAAAAAAGPHRHDKDDDVNIDEQLLG